MSIKLLRIKEAEFATTMSLKVLSSLRVGALYTPWPKAYWVAVLSERRTSCTAYMFFELFP